LCRQKQRTKAYTSKNVILIEQVSSLVQHSIPPKFNEPGAPAISCIIGDHKVEKALLDLGAGVNLLPHRIYLQLGWGELKSTTVIFQMADRSIKKPLGIIEDVIIHMDKFYFPVDFIVLDIDPVPNPDNMILVILGRPFLATADANINCIIEIMKISFGNMKVKLNIFNAFQHLLDKSECFFLDIIEESVEDSLPCILTKDPLGACVTHIRLEDFHTG
jgi:hypothetical protein